MITIFAYWQVLISCCCCRRRRRVVIVVGVNVDFVAGVVADVGT